MDATPSPTEHQLLEQEALLLAHLRDEEQTLEALIVSVGEVRDALITRDGERLTAALQAEAECLQLGDTMRTKRANFRKELAASLNVAVEQITLSQLSLWVSSECRAELAHFRDRLTEMSAELSRLNRQNAAMIRQSLDLTQRIIGQLTGTGPHFASYNAAGRSENSQTGPVLQWGG